MKKIMGALFSLIQFVAVNFFCVRQVYYNFIFKSVFLEFCKKKKYINILYPNLPYEYIIVLLWVGYGLFTKFGPMVIACVLRTAIISSCFVRQESETEKYKNFKAIFYQSIIIITFVY